MRLLTVDIVSHHDIDLLASCAGCCGPQYGDDTTSFSRLQSLSVQGHPAMCSRNYTDTGNVCCARDCVFTRPLRDVETRRQRNGLPHALCVDGSFCPMTCWF